ncbi:MAG TPA: protein translocase subunit SecD [Candidatus Moranbacteria bacterium]|mgnify:CR=1 FL=1|nr:protein translocase subunit SecD [Candidatus Moranbacteria bacterium]
MNTKSKLRLKFALVMLLFAASALVSYPEAVRGVPYLHNSLAKLKLSLGLDLQGGIHLEYQADVSKIEADKISESLSGAQDVIERRVNAFGVGEPLVQAARRGDDYRIIVELPGIKDIEQAKQKIKETPLLEFKQEGEPSAEIKEMFDNLNEEAKSQAEETLKKALAGQDFAALAKELSQDPGTKEKGGDLDFVKKGTFVPEFDEVLFGKNLKAGEVYGQLVETQFGWHIIKFEESRGEGEEKEVRARHILFAKQSPEQYSEFKFVDTGLTGRNLKSATVVFASQGISEPQISLKFDDEGTKMFAELTKNNIGKPLAIFLDGELLSSPTVQTEITNGEAVITGSFTVTEAKELAKNLNQGALPVPLTLVSQSSIEASLGEASLRQSLKAGAIGLGTVIFFMVVYYRFLGLAASLALVIYTALMISIFKIFPGITLTLSGIAGFILSIGMAVDANILIFERTKEELRRGRSSRAALEEGFVRAWTSIRDGNVSSLITAAILYGMGTGFVKGFAATLFLGVVVSMFTAVVVSRTILRFISGDWADKHPWVFMHVAKGGYIENKTEKK